MKFSYEGLFSVKELYSVISGWFFEKGWDWHEYVNEEQITPTGKQIRLVVEPWKSSSDYYKLVIKIKAHFIDVKEVEVEKKEEKLKLDHGVVRMTFDAWILSDRHEVWSKKPFTWFLTVIMDKYFFRNHLDKMRKWLESDVDDLHDKIKTYLNVFKYTYQS